MKILLPVLMAAPLLLIMPAAAPQAAREDGKMNALTIRWWGQACFSISDGQTTVLTDPFPADFGYKLPDVEPQVVLVTHEHRDHNAVDTVRGRPAVLRGPGEHQAAGLTFTGLAAAHDADGGAKRGANTLFVWEMAGRRLAHLGDLGAPLTDKQVAALGRVEVLMLPVGGYYTLEPAQALEVAVRLQPAFLLPMHYRTPAVPRLPIAPLDDFLKLATEKGWQVQRTDAVSLMLPTDQWPAPTTVMVLPLE